MTITRKYANPPIIEIVCEFRFEVEDPNDLTVPGRFYERIQSDYPIKEEFHEFEVGLEFSKSKKELQQKLRAKMLGMQYKSKDGKEIIRVAPNFVSAHRLPPYPTWEAFFPIAKRAFETFRYIVQPKGIERVGVRYIDRIEIPQTSFELSEYLMIYPQKPEGIGRSIGRLFMRLEIPFNEGRDVLVIMIHNPLGSPAGKTWIILDWDYALVQPSKLKMDSILSWVEEAHDRVIEAFEKSISDASRQLFEEVK